MLEVDETHEQVNLRWFYRPEDARSGRQVWHGAAEIFKQFQYTDWNPTSSVEGVCRVHTLEEYERLDRITEKDLYWRSTYNPETGGFVPDNVRVFCFCETPYNPDRPMVECDACKNWFHLDCIGLRKDSPELVAGSEGYVCANCEVRREVFAGRTPRKEIDTKLQALEEQTERLRQSFPGPSTSSLPVPGPPTPEEEGPDILELATAVLTGMEAVHEKQPKAKAKPKKPRAQKKKTKAGKVDGRTREGRMAKVAASLADADNVKVKKRPGRKPNKFTKTGRRRQRRDPDAPKRGRTAFNFFLQDFRKKYLVSHTTSLPLSPLFLLSLAIFADHHHAHRSFTVFSFVF